MCKEHILGIDVSKSKLDLFDLETNESSVLENTYPDLTKFFKSKQKEKGLLVVFEPTGVYSQNLIKVLNDLDIKYFQVSLKVIHEMGKALGDRNKTDKVCAKKIAKMGELLLSFKDDKEIKTRIIEKVPNEYLIAKNYLTQLESLKVMKRKIKQIKTNLEKQPFKKEMKEMKKFYEKQITEIEKQEEKMMTKLDTMIEELGYSENVQKLVTIPGISRKTAILLGVFFISLIMKGVKRDELKKVKSYSGLDPNKKSSGEYLDKTRISKAGDKKVRAGLFTPLMSVWYRLMDNPKYKDTVIGKHAQRMKKKFVKNGKGAKAVICATSGKILITAWAMFNDNVPYNRA